MADKMEVVTVQHHVMRPKLLYIWKLFIVCTLFTYSKYLLAAVICCHDNKPPSSSNAIFDCTVAAGMDMFCNGSTGSGSGDVFGSVTLDSGAGTAVEHTG